MFRRVPCSHRKQLLNIEVHLPVSVHLPVCMGYDPTTDIVPDMSSHFNICKKTSTKKDSPKSQNYFFFNEDYA